MLFSATKTPKTDALTTFALKKEPIYIGVDDSKDEATVDGLEQGYVVCPSEKRFLLLFTFLKKNRKKKVMVFFSSCLAVKYFHELLNYIDLPVMCIHVRYLFMLLNLVKIVNLLNLIRVSKNKKSEQLHFFNSVMQKLVYCYVLM
jgi:hypothetical protein